MRKKTFNMREICLDTETTGLDPKDGHKIIEIACVEMVNKIKTGRVFHKYVNPRRSVPQEAFAIHGISTEFLQDKPIFDHIAREFLEFIDGAKLVIHNAPFDLKFLNYELSILGLEMIDKNNVVDTLVMARTKFPGSPNSLDALCKRFNIDLSARTKHTAILDTTLLCDVYVELTGGLQSGLDLSTKEKAADQQFLSTSVLAKSVTPKKQILPERHFPMSDEDLQKHREFITKNFNSNFWNY